MLPGPVIMSTGASSAAVGVGAAVGQQRDRLRAADGPHLVDAEQRGRGQDRRVRQATELGLRRAGDHQRVHPGGLRGHHVHHDAGRIDGVAAGHVQPDPLDGHPAFGDRRAGRQRRWWCRCGAGRRARRGCARSRPPAPRGRRGRASGARPPVFRRAPGPASGRTPSKDSPYSRAASAPRVGDRVDDGPDLGHDSVDVDAAARQRGAQARRRQRAATQVDAPQEP